MRVERQYIIRLTDGPQSLTRKMLNLLDGLPRGSGVRRLEWLAGHWYHLSVEFTSEAIEAGWRAGLPYGGTIAELEPWVEN